jgi:hypothetical protein
LVVSGWLLADYTSDDSLLKQALLLSAKIHFRLPQCSKTRLIVIRSAVLTIAQIVCHADGLCH